MVICLTGAKFSMDAEVLRWEGHVEPTETDVDQSQNWETYQDPITGEILNKWVPGEADDPDTPEDESSQVKTIACLARGIASGGTRVTGSTERFGDTYENIEMVRLWVPAKTKLYKSDRITNIRDRRGGTVIWTEEDGSPTIFNVSGIVPLFDPFNNHTESYISLERIDS